MYREKSILGRKIKDLVNEADGSTRSRGVARTFIRTAVVVVRRRIVWSREREKLFRGAIAWCERVSITSKKKSCRRKSKNEKKGNVCSVRRTFASCSG